MFSFIGMSWYVPAVTLRARSISDVSPESRNAALGSNGRIGWLFLGRRCGGDTHLTVRAMSVLRNVVTDAKEHCKPDSNSGRPTSLAGMRRTRTQEKLIPANRCNWTYERPGTQANLSGAEYAQTKRALITRALFVFVYLTARFVCNLLL